MRINFDLFDLRVFLAISDFGNFHKAAEVLNLSQSALSRRLTNLEKRIGTSLFERSTRKVMLTSSGRKFEPIARRTLDELESTVLSMSDVGARHEGHINIAAIPTTAIYFLPRVIEQFNRKYPLIRLRVLDQSPQEGLESVIRGEVEFGINMIGSMETEVTFTHLLDDPYVLACHRNHPLAKRRNLHWRDLEGHALIRIGRANSGNGALLDSALTKADVGLNWFYEVNNLTTSLGFVETGLGASILPRLATPYVRHPVIVIKALLSPKVCRPIGIVERRKGRLSSAAKGLRDLLLANWQRFGRGEP